MTAQTATPAITPAREAATVVLLRDAPAGVEVFLVKRHGLSDVLGGAYVFPGGKVDRNDTDARLLAKLDAPRERLHAALGEADLASEAAIGLFVAACRETFEESGVLLVEEATERQVREAQAHAREGVSFGEIVARLGVRPHWDNLVPWSRWITPNVPQMINKRFDARFFLASMPSAQSARHDDHEATESLWLRPRAVLEQYWERQINLAPAQIMSLAVLSRYRNVAEAMNTAKAARPPAIQPEPFRHEGSRAIAFPGDERHPVRERALAGPSFLVYRNERFEPAGGFEALFA